MKHLIISALFGLVAGAAAAATKKTVTFNAVDAVTVTADVYLAHPETAPFIVLFHQARSSRGEYLKIAPKLNELGFNVIAVDQRSGDAFAGVDNETAWSARKMNMAEGYLAALPDMESAVAYARKNYAKGKLILWGSSYSASLVLKMAGEKSAAADAVLAFSPGEYFDDQPAGFIRKSAQNIRIPVFITSAKSEQSEWLPIFQAIPAKSKSSFLPSVEGTHGSGALFKSEKDGQEYWRAVNKFLDQFLK